MKSTKPKSTHGGPRPGAGRKKGDGPVTKAMQAFRLQAMAEGISPLQVMLSAMRDYVKQGKIEQAIHVAGMAAPYVHPRLLATQVTVRRPDEMSDDELLASIAIDESEFARLQSTVAPDACESVPGTAGETRH